MTETVKLTASDGADGDAFGYNVSISRDTVAVGALFAHGGAGAAYVFVKPASGWSSTTQTAELTASDASTFDNMGSVAISGDTVVTGAYGHNNFRGAAYVFVKPRTRLERHDADGGVQQPKGESDLRILSRGPG